MLSPNIMQIYLQLLMHLPPILEQSFFLRFQTLNLFLTHFLLLLSHNLSSYSVGFQIYLKNLTTSHYVYLGHSGSALSSLSFHITSNKPSCYYCCSQNIISLRILVSSFWKDIMSLSSESFSGFPCNSEYKLRAFKWASFMVLFSLFHAGSFSDLRFFCCLYHLLRTGILVLS